MGVLLYVGAALPLVWGVAHLFATQGVVEGFNELMKRCNKPGAPERKHKELMAVTVSVVTRYVPCLPITPTTASPSVRRGRAEGR